MVLEGVLCATLGCLVRSDRWVRGTTQIFLADARTQTFVTECPARRVAYLARVALSSRKTCNAIAQRVNMFDVSCIE